MDIDKQRNWKGCLWIVLCVGVVYGALQNGNWVPVSDSAVYLSLARNLASGKGYLSNGFPVSKVPPGCPLVLAAAMRVSPSFWFLNALPMTFLLATAICWYWILGRFASPGHSFLVVLTCAIIFSYYRLSNLLYADALFLFLMSATILIAFQINENKPVSWRLPVMILLCASLVTLRWVGFLGWLLVAGSLVSGQAKPRLDRRWITLALSGLVVMGTFLGLKYMLKIEAHEELVGMKTPMEVTLARPYEILDLGKGIWLQAKKLSSSGNWLSWLFLPPSQLGSSLKTLGLVINALGWVLIVLFVAYLIPALRRRQWVWFGVLMYCGALCFRWGNPNVRYFVPVLPLLLLGIWQGVEHLRSLPCAAMWRKFGKSVIISIFVGIVASNLPLFAIEVYIARSNDFYALYYAGQCKELIAAAQYLNCHGVEDNQIAMNELYINLGNAKRNSLAFRSIVMLKGKAIRIVPSDVCRDRPNEKLVEWARGEGIKFYLCRMPDSPWRAWHFRLPWLQEKITGKATGLLNPYVNLYEIRDGEASKVNVIYSDYRLNRVPGL